MFARFTTVQVNADKIDEVIKLYDESVVPGGKAQKGFCGIYLFTDRKTGNGVSVSLWESEEDAVANEQVGKFAEYFTAAPVQEGYEVSVNA